MYRRPMVVANWKMHTTSAEALVLGSHLRTVAEKHDDLDLVILPPALWLPTLAEQLHHRPRTLQFGIQDFYPASEGAFTGELGLGMIKGLASYALVGHSERRTIFGESPVFINEKVRAALTHHLRPIVCVGELTRVMFQTRGRGRPTISERDSDVLKQLASALEGVSGRELELVTICYEPLWAISSQGGQICPGSHAQAVLAQIRSALASRYGQQIAERVRLLYGGSVNGKTIEEYVAQPDIDGVLVGAASLKMTDFRPIVEAVAGSRQ